MNRAGHKGALIVAEEQDDTAELLAQTMIQSERSRAGEKIELLVSILGNGDAAVVFNESLFLGDGDDDFDDKVDDDGDDDDYSADGDK